MTTTEMLLATLTSHATRDELRPLAAFIGDCVARRDNSTLARFHDRARQLRGALAPDAWLRGYLDGLTGVLESYFARVEQATQLEYLVREVGEEALWCEILRTLQERELNQIGLGDAIRVRAPGVASSKSAISVALDELRNRELVEYVPSPSNRREHVHGLTSRGADVCRTLGWAREPSASPEPPRTQAERTAATGAQAQGTVTAPRIPPAGVAAGGGRRPTNPPPMTNKLSRIDPS